MRVADIARCVPSSALLMHDNRHCVSFENLFDRGSDVLESKVKNSLSALSRIYTHVSSFQMAAKMDGTDQYHLLGR